MELQLARQYHKSIELLTELADSPVVSDEERDAYESQLFATVNQAKDFRRAVIHRLTQG